MTLFFVGWASSFAHADEGSRPLTADQFLTRIDGNLPELGRLGADVLAAEAAIAEAEKLPDLGVSYEREEVFAEGEGLVQKSAISLGWSFDFSGRRGQRIKSAELSALATRTGNARKEHLILISALEVYYQAAWAKLRVASLRRTRVPFAKLVEQLKSRVGEGDASGYDLARFELELSEHDDRLAEAEAEYSVARSRLSGLLGVPSGTVEPSDVLDLPPPPGPPRASSVPLRSDVEATSHWGDSGRALVRAAGRWWIPTLDLSVGYMNTDLGPGSGAGADTAHGYSAMITASVPLFSRGEAERKRGEARTRRAQATRGILERQIPVEIETAEELLRSRADRTGRFTGKQLVQVAALVKKTEDAYHGGEATALELRDAYRQAATADLRYIDLRYQSRLAELNLRRASGQRDQGGTQ